MHSELGTARQGKLKCHDSSETNAMAVKTNGKSVAPESSRQTVPILRLAFAKQSCRKLL